MRMREIRYTQLYYDEEKEQEIFPSKMDGKPRVVSLDAKMFRTHGHTDFADDDSLIKDYLIREVQHFNKFGVYYNWIITSMGNIYHITPSNKAGHSSVFKLYSSKISKFIPEYCPLHDIDVKDLNNTPDKLIESICLEINEPGGSFNMIQENTLKDLLAYIMQQNEKIKPFNIINRSDIPRMNVDKQSIGIEAYKGRLSQLVVLSSYALKLSREDRFIITEEYRLDYQQ